MKTVRWRSTALQQGWTMVPNVVVDAPISPGAFRLWCVLADYARQDETCFAGQDTLAERLHTTTRTIRTWITELVDVGLVENIQRGLGKTNEYVLTLPGEESCSEAETRPVRQPASEPSKEEEDALEQDKTLATASQPRQRNIIWDSLVDAGFAEPRTASERSDFGKTVRELREVIPDDATAEQIVRSITLRKRAWEREYPGVSFTHHVVRNKWGELGKMAGATVDRAPTQVEVPEELLTPEEYHEWKRTASAWQVAIYQDRFNVSDDGLPD